MVDFDDVLFEDSVSSDDEGGVYEDFFDDEEFEFQDEDFEFENGPFGGFDD